MRRLFIKIMVIVLSFSLLEAQYAVAHHDIDHHTHEHSEQCDIFIYADNHNLIDLTLDEHFLSLVLVDVLHSVAQSIAERIIETQPARAPPFASPILINV